MILKIENSTLTARKQRTNGKDTAWTLTCYPNTLPSLAPPCQDQGCEQEGRGCHTGPQGQEAQSRCPLWCHRRPVAVGPGTKAAHLAITAMLGTHQCLPTLCKEGNCKSFPFCSQLESFLSQKCAALSPTGQRNPPSPGNACGRLWPLPCTPACSHRCWG